MTLLTRRILAKVPVVAPFLSINLARAAAILLIVGEDPANATPAEIKQAAIAGI